MYSIVDLMREFMPFFILPIAIAVLRIVYNIVHDLAHGCYMADMAEELMKENDKLIKAEKEKINIDKDLQKYFNYKE